MTDAPNASSPDPGGKPAPVKRKSRKLKWILIAGGGVVVLLLLLALLAPTIAGTGFVRSIVVSKINENLNGKVQIADWSLGWTSGIRVEGVKVFDDAGAQILELGRASTQLPLTKAISGDLQLGKVVVEGLNFNLKIDENGKTNLDNLVKVTDTAGQQPVPSSPAAEASKLPDVSADIEIKDVKGSITQNRTGDPPVVIFIDSINGTVKIPNINQPIENNVQIQSRVGNGPAGTISLVGKAEAIKNNQLAPQTAIVDQKLEIKSIDTSGFKAFVPKDVGLDELAGNVSGTVLVKLEGTKGGSLNVDILCSGLAIGGKLLKGDVYKSDRVTIVAPVAIAIPEGAKDFNAARLTTTEQNPIQIKTTETTVFATLNVTPAALQNVAAMQKPGDTGKVYAKVVVDAGQLARQLPHALQLAEGVTLSSGELTSATEIDLSADKAALVQNVILAKIAGTRDGKNVQLKPISLTIKGSSIGGGNLVQSLRDVDAQLTGADFGGWLRGASIADLTGRATIDLAKMQAELGQIIDFHGVTTAGSIIADLTNKGDLSSDTGTGECSFKVDVHDLQVAGLPDQLEPVKQPYMQLYAGGKIARGGTKGIRSIDDIVVTLTSGSAENSTAKLMLNADVSLADAIDATFKLSKFDLDLARAQTEFAPLIKALRESGIVLAGGKLAVTAEGSYKGSIADLTDFTIAANGVSIRQQKDGVTKNLLQNYTLNVQAAAKVNTAASIELKASKLAITDSTKLINVQKVNDGDFVVYLGDNSTYASGKLQIASDLGAINELLKPFQHPGDAAKTSTGQIQSGQLAGTVDLVHASAITNVTGDLKISNLVVLSANGPTPQQELAVAIRAKLPDDARSVTADAITVASQLVSADIKDTTINLAGDTQPNAGPLAMVQKANIAVAVKDLPGLYALAMAFAPAEPAPASTDKNAATPLPPLQFTGGNLNFVATVVPRGDAAQIDVSDLSGSGIAIKRGDGSYAAEPFSVKLSANVSGISDTKNLVAKVDRLEGKLGIADLAMTEPIAISQSAGRTTASGTIQLTAGNIERVCQLLEALAAAKPGSKYPYQGTLTLTEKIGSVGDTISLSGKADITNFVVNQDGKPVFKENQVAIANELSADTAAKVLNITKVTAVMQSSQALNLTATGKLSDWENARQLDGMVIDLGYDLAKIWPIVKPMVPPESQETVKDLVIEGKYQKQFTVSGSYPANMPFQQAIQKIKADGDIEVSMLQVKGLDVRNLIIPIALRGGVAMTVYGNRPGGGQNLAAPADCNSGKLDVGNVFIALRDEAMNLTMSPNHKLLSNAQLNPVLAQSLGKYFNILFSDASQARGTVDVSVLECDKVPVADLIRQKGQIKLSMSIKNLELDGPVPQIIANAIPRLKGESGALTGEIIDARIDIGNGVVQSDIPLKLGRLEQPMHFAGGIGLESLDLRNFAAIVPTRWLDDTWEKYAPDGIALPFTGSSLKAQPQLAQFTAAIAKVAAQAEAGKGLEKLLGGGKKKEPENTPADPQQHQQQPQPEKKNDPLGDLLSGLGKKKEKPPENPAPQDQKKQEEQKNKTRNR